MSLRFFVHPQFSIGRNMVEVLCIQVWLIVRGRSMHPELR